ncbi:MAG: HD domain-containing protein [Bacteroidales bacterium]|nr:HD domain-containing protein [Bacteroidales bacterium]MCF8333835.1 HD domain-containing protein [Bacteroidales bacterium]
MTQKQLEHFYHWFDVYTKSFSFNNETDWQNIHLKIEHTYRVRDAILDIGKKEGLYGNRLMLAETMALFHDAGRFKQYYWYKTFKDSLSENHARLGVEELENAGVLEDLPIPEKEIILKAIYNHNIPQLPVSMDVEEKYFSCLLRDADKVDILRVVTEYYEKKHENQNKTIQLELSNENEISDSVFEAFMQGRIIHVSDLKFLNDFKLLQVAWINDINFKRSFELIARGGYIEKIIKTLPDGSKKKRIIDYVRSFFEKEDAQLITQ